MLNLPNDFLNRLKIELSELEDNKVIYSLNFDAKNGLIFNKLKSNNDLINNIIDEYNLINLYSGLNYKYYTYDKNSLNNINISPGKSIYHHQGLYYIQEPSAAKVLSNVEFNNNDIVLDMCASPGGKSIDLLSNNLINDGFLVANEIDIERAKIMSKNFERLGFDNYIITNNTAEELYNNFNEFFDKVILDAPCSGEGMMRKNEIAIKQWSISLIKKMSNIQKELIEYAYKMTKPNGIIIYSTCTYAKEEDEEIINYITDKYKNLNIIYTQKIYLQDDIGEGQFYTILKKLDSSKVNNDIINTKSFKIDIISYNQIDKKILNNISQTINTNFLSNINYNIVKYKNSIYLLRNNIPINLFANLKIIRLGIEFILLNENNNFISHSFTHSRFYSSFINIFDMNDDDTNKYLKGESIKTNSNIKGYVLITNKKIPLGMAKISNNMIKNHYPKGLRNL